MEENENIEEVQGVEPNEEQVDQPQEEVVEQESPVSYKDDGTIVLDMNKINELEDAVQEQDTDEVPVRDESGASEEVREENVEATNEEVAEQSVQEEVNDTVEAANAAIDKAEATGQALPENIQKLVDFVNDTGGSVEDYVKLNKDYERNG
jgi:regulatory protein YycH of two-component signal transduction system YycFG